jgi:diguanylate cyclase (GGDEF)-like protein
MNSGWLHHIAKNLSAGGMLSYSWQKPDRYQWLGDFSALGLDGAEVPESNDQLHRLLNPQDIPERMVSFHALLSGAISHLRVRYRLRCADGSYAEIEETANLHTEGGSAAGIFGTLRLIHPDRADVPPANLIGLRNDLSTTHQGRIRLQHAIEAWRHETPYRDDRCGFLLVFGIDHFTMFNESFGARFADEIIDKTGLRLREIAGEGAEVSRIDGDVFGILFSKAHHGELPVFAKYIITNLSDYALETSKGPLAVGLSAGGIALNPRMEMDSPSVVTGAEMAMRKAKERGRSCFVSYDEASAEAGDTRTMLKTADDFLRALKENRVRLAFQPVMDTASHCVSFHEGLIRMFDERGKMQAAASFIPAVEKLGLSRVVDHYALKTAIEELDLFSSLSLSVNVSNQTLNDKEWLRTIVLALRERPSVAKRLIVEITESCVIHSGENLQRIVRTLQDLGCRVALDDFGAGYTAFLQLKELNVDIIKIDKAFIRNIGESQNKLFVRTLQNLADGVNVKTVGEGAETLAEAKLLADDGVNYIQGYVYGFPQVERVWLPKEHMHRKIMTESSPRAGMVRHVGGRL